MPQLQQSAEGGGALDVAWVVPFVYRYTQGFELVRARSRPEVTSRDASAALNEQLGQRTHPGARDPHEVHMAFGREPPQISGVRRGLGGARILRKRDH